MRKRLIVALLMVFLSFAPVYAGHSNAGGYAFCECDPVGNFCPCCGSTLQAVISEEQQTTDKDATVVNESASLGLGAVIILTLLWLKMRA